MDIYIREANIADVQAIAKVHVATWNSTYENIIPEVYLKSKTCKGQEEKWLKRIFENDATNEFLYVALTENDDIIGFACGSAQNDDIKFKGTIAAIYILKDFQRKGLGKKLIKTIVERLDKNGIENLIIWAFAENPSCSFYEHINGKKVRKKTENIGGKEMIETGYGWTNIKELLYRLS